MIIKEQEKRRSAAGKCLMPQVAIEPKLRIVPCRACFICAWADGGEGANKLLFPRCPGPGSQGRCRCRCLIGELRDRQEQPWRAEAGPAQGGSSR